jgi:hypothetical protein
MSRDVVRLRTPFLALEFFSGKRLIGGGTRIILQQQDIATLPAIKHDLSKVNRAHKSERLKP